MGKVSSRVIEVYAHWKGLSQPTLLGLLHMIPSRGKEVFAFDYAEHWIRQNHRFVLDPVLQWVPGLQYAPMKQINFGMFLDSAPDRWGRLLMRRREALNAREEGRPERQLLESDYLLGVYDEHRMGALRFRDSRGSFLDNTSKHAAPPWSSLRELEKASLALENEDSEKNSNYTKWLNLLIIPGSSLGGARPKANIIDVNKHPWIAKFPSAHDNQDVGLWEMLLHILAKKAGIHVHDASVHRFNSRHHTFLSKRFDRTDTGERIHFASAMTLLQRSDGDDASEGASYLEIAEFIIQQSVHPAKDLEELWRRIVFNMCVSNTDDHLRNHGFLLTSEGWRLSPAYDMNPNAMGYGLKLNVSESDNAQDLSLAMDVAPYFRLNSKSTEQVLKNVLLSVSQWRQEASRLGISSSAQEKMATAFRLA